MNLPMPAYDFKKIEKKWQQYWEKHKTYGASNDAIKPKFYGLVEFPYPSGEGLHVGHPRSYTALDVICRKKRMEGFNVLLPMGWDAFGLPAEQYAVKTGTHPAVITKKNIATFKRQLQALGMGFDWSREVDTTDSEYYRWTQWIFLQLFKQGLAYKATAAINWCLSCKIGLANEEVVNGACERCGGPVEKRDKEQWMLRITQYADRLIDDLHYLDYIEPVKVQQRNWIGRSEGARIKFPLPDITEPEFGGDHFQNFLEVFTTRPDTIFGATYMVIAPEHPLITKLASSIKNKVAVKNYVEKARGKSDLERTDLAKEKTGVELKGIRARNPLTDEDIPIWVADYVLPHYGTGAIMAVPAHDSRDYAFAKKYKLPMKIVTCPHYPSPTCPVLKDAYEGDGHNIESDFLNGLPTSEAKQKIIAWLEEQGVGSREVQYKLRDWVFSRQRYWGEPIPMVHCEKCKDKSKYGDGWMPLPEDALPLKLPEIKKYEVADTGESPLSKIPAWVKTTCPECGGAAKRETDTMPNWAGSSWYFLRYAAPHDTKFFSHTEWQKEEIQPDDLDKRLFALLKCIKTLFSAHDIPFWIAGSLMMNGLNRKLWRHMHDIDMFVRGSDWERILEFLRADGFIIHEEHNGWNRVEKDGCQVEICPATPLEGELYTHLRHGQEQVLHRYDLELAERGWLWGVPFRTISPTYMLRFYRFLRDKFPKTRDKEADRQKMEFLEAYLANPLNYWMPVTWYNGGMEHTTLHVLYSRFWNKFLFDIGAAPTSEPYEKRTSHGMILAKGGEKMSKSKGNVVNPDDIVAAHGADVFRAYEMFMGPFDQAAEWNPRGLIGVSRFLQKVWGIGLSLRGATPRGDEAIPRGKGDVRNLTRLLHQTIRKVTEDIESMHFNTAISALMQCSNEMQKAEGVTAEQFKIFLQLLSPFAPHMAEELWSTIGEKGSITHAAWPVFDPELAREEKIELVIQVNGKVRDKIMMPADISVEDARRTALASEKVQKWLAGKEPADVIVVQGRLVNVVIT